MTSQQELERNWMLSELQTGTILDIGSAEAIYIEDILKQRTKNITLCDKREFTHSSKAKKLNIVVDDFRELKESDVGLFDNIICLDVLQYVAMDSYGFWREVPYTHSVYYTQKDALYYLSQLLSPKGKLMLTLPYGKWEDLGWMITYQDTMIAELRQGFNVTKEKFFTLTDQEQGVWQEVSEAECPFKSILVGKSGISPASICCLVIEPKVG